MPLDAVHNERSWNWELSESALCVCGHCSCSHVIKCSNFGLMGGFLSNFLVPPEQERGWLPGQAVAECGWRHKDKTKRQWPLGSGVLLQHHHGAPLVSKPGVRDGLQEKRLKMGFEQRAAVLHMLCFQTWRRTHSVRRALVKWSCDDAVSCGWSYSASHGARQQECRCWVMEEGAQKCAAPPPP